MTHPLPLPPKATELPPLRLHVPSPVAPAWVRPGYDSDWECPVARRYSGPGYALGMLGLLMTLWALLPLVLVALAVVWAWGRATGRGR